MLNPEYIQIMNNKLSFTLRAWESLQKMHTQNLVNQIGNGSDSFQSLSISLEGDNVRDKYILNDLINQIQQFDLIQNLEVYVGYLNLIQKDTFKIFFNNISTLSQLQKLSLTFDFKTIDISSLQDYQQLSSLSKQIPQLDELVLTLCKGTLMDFGDSNNIISLLLTNQTQISTFKLELRDIDFKNTLMISIKENLSKLSKLQQLDITLKKSETPIEFKSIVQNFFFLNLNSLSITLQLCQIQERESKFSVFDNSTQCQAKKINLRFVEVENILNITTSILNEICCLKNLESFSFCLDKIKGLENLQMDNQSCKILSNLKNINFEIIDSIVSLSLNNFIISSTFSDNEQLTICQGVNKIYFKSYDKGSKRFKFVNNCLKKQEFLQLIQELDIYKISNENFKTLKQEDLYNNQFVILNKNISFEEISIVSTIDQEYLNNLINNDKQINKNDLKIYKIELINNQYNQLSIDQIQKVLINKAQLLKCSSFQIDFQNSLMICNQKDISKLQQLDLILKNRETPIELKSIVQNQLLLNLNSISITLEKCQTQESQSRFFELDNQRLSQVKEINLKFVKVENILNIITRILNEISSFQNLENFSFCLCKIKGLEKLQIDTKNCKFLSNLKNINFEMINSDISLSLIKFIVNSTFNDKEKLTVCQSKNKIHFQTQDRGFRSFKLVNNSLGQQEFLQLIQELGIYKISKETFKKLQLVDLNNNYFDVLNKNITFEELCIQQTVNQYSINDLTNYLGSIDKNSFKIFKLQLFKNECNQLDTVQFFKNLINITEILKCSSFNVLFKLKKQPFFSEIRDEKNNFNIQVNDQQRSVYIFKKFLGLLTENNIPINIFKINCKIDSDIWSGIHLRHFRFTGIQQLQIKGYASLDSDEIKLFLLETLKQSQLISFIFQIDYYDYELDTTDDLKLWIQNLKEENLQIKKMRILKIEINGKKLLLKNILRKSKSLVIL
ncbi:hypothetical protein ABPG74_012870 [Tetrahymena malaccensis]